MKKPIVRLYDSIGLGVVILYPSGVLFSNQTGGTACLQPEIEGIFVPLRNDYELPAGPLWSPELELTEYFCGPKHEGSGAVSGLDDADADFMEALLTRFNLHPPIQVNRQMLRKSHEAWVHVTIEGDDRGTFAGFSPYPRRGVLTWCNSD